MNGRRVCFGPSVWRGLVRRTTAAAAAAVEMEAAVVEGITRAGTGAGLVYTAVAHMTGVLLLYSVTQNLRSGGDVCVCVCGDE